MRLQKKWTISADHTRALDLMAQIDGLSKMRLKDAMAKGAVFWSRKGKQQRLRRATAELNTGDQLFLNYDDELLQRTAAAPVLIQDLNRYSIWSKPAGLLAQGNEWGDHCSLLRQVELQCGGGRAVLLVHRLDREASGLMLVAHDQAMAGKLSALFVARTIKKTYQVRVRGQLPAGGSIEAPLDDKNALSHYRLHTYDTASDTSLAQVEIDTGRKHQIRRHFAHIGHPVLGDPLYGERNSWADGLQLRAVRLQFVCPLRKHARDFALAEEECLFAMASN